jgi:primosomal protein N' (replication factor Y)
VLAPLSKLGILIVDEEHDPSYKQDDGVRYNGRDTAVMRARLLGCPVVLGSATPSLESWNNAREGRYTRILMPERVTPAPKPFMEVVDLRGRDLVAHGGLSEHLANHLTRNFEAGNQSLLFLNRRGYAANLQCYGCGEIVECANCSVGLTLHATQRKLHCHHCDARSPVPDRCPSCSADSLISQGLGTQRLEATVRKLLPRARVARMDRDATATKGATGVILEDWKNKRFDILIGTQMITKGHDVPGVTLVGVVHADAGLSVPDFRAAERTAQLLAQVAGRAGRGDERGLCILQSYQPDHPAIQAAARDSYDAFCQAELEARSELAYPPTSRMVLLRLSGTDRAATERLALQAARILEPMIAAEPGASLRGPAPAMLERVKGRYRFKLQLRGPNGAPLRYAASVARARLMAASRNSGLRVAVDVDPYDTV